MFKILSKRNYEIGDILIFKGESNRFKTGKKYEISQISIIDYEIDDIDHNYGNQVLYFKCTDFGCFAKYADDNFETLEEYRNNKLREILK
jgi:hypothetical protein